MNRKKQREWIFKIIFENQINEVSNIKDSFYNHEIDLGEDSFCYLSLKSYLENYNDINEIILNQIGKSSFNRLSKADKSILFLSINEIFYLEIPVSVSINEAVNLSKKYSTSDGYKFINSVLGKISKKRL
ncbi:transcription antitermination factor NusB [Anaerococcus porci]|uniref:Transcription antitermination factor NusB n=1 Tax=Anaerococcus porci TaxID=2652269 RepID=A0A6N7VDR1_9FIRM|nr:transcription antitermination factor NusB [Anaerococcus porci]MDY3007152.1 transcription antitermination factor NusB [Anaerococcus porci]MSS77011.1 transcription antitermination factor NusB [Anaerococcus porci]